MCFVMSYRVSKSEPRCIVLLSPHRFRDAKHWAAFHLIGFDQYINLMTIKHAQIDHRLNETERQVLNLMKDDALNSQRGEPRR